jgi:hypothetical protein
MCSVLVDEAGPTLRRDEPAARFDLFLASRRDFGHRPALWVDGGSPTYCELDDAARRQTAVIRSARRQRVAARKLQCGLLVNRPPTAYAAVPASRMAGSAYVPLNALGIARRYLSLGIYRPASAGIFP